VLAKFPARTWVQTELPAACLKYPEVQAVQTVDPSPENPALQTQEDDPATAVVAPDTGQMKQEEEPAIDVLPMGQGEELVAATLAGVPPIEA